MTRRMASASIGDLVEPIKSCDPRRAESGTRIRYVDISSVDRDTKSINDAALIVATDAPSRARQVVLEGDVLVSTVRPSLNAVAMVPVRLNGAIASTGFSVLRPKPDRLDGRYLFHWVRSPAFVDQMTRLATGASYPAVSDRIVLASEMPIFPLQEQARIAHVLDKADAIRRRRKETMELIEDLLRSAFLEMFGDPVTNPKGWPKKALGELVTVTDGTHKTPTYVAEGVPFLSAKNIRANRIDWSNTKFITVKEHRDLVRRCQPKMGDVLLTKSGTIGEAACVDRNIEFSLFESAALLKPNPTRLTANVLVALLNDGSTKRAYNDDIKGARENKRNEPQPGSSESIESC